MSPVSWGDIFTLLLRGDRIMELRHSFGCALLHSAPCASIRFVRRPDQGLFVGPSAPPHGDPGAAATFSSLSSNLPGAGPRPHCLARTSLVGGFMKSYLTRDIRNVGIVGHGGTGKTQLVSSLLFTAGMTPRWGKIAEGSTTTDWDEEEIARKISIQTGLVHAEWPATPTGPSGSSEKVKINFIDLPGYSTFITEAKASLIAADAALIAVDAHVGSQVTRKKFGTIAPSTTFPVPSSSPGWTANSRVSNAPWNRSRRFSA